MTESLLQIAKNAAIAEAESQIKLGKQLQTEGLKIIRDIQSDDNPDKANMLKAATATIKEGCAITAKAMENIIKLRK